MTHTKTNTMHRYTNTKIQAKLKDILYCTIFKSLGISSFLPCFLFCSASPDISHPFPTITILRISITKAFSHPATAYIPTFIISWRALSGQQQNNWRDRKPEEWWSSCRKVWQNFHEYLHTISPQLLASILLPNYIQTIPSFPPRLADCQL